MPRLRRSRSVVYEPELPQEAKLAWLVAGHTGPLPPEVAAKRESAREAAWSMLSRAQKAVYGAPDPDMLARCEADSDRREAAIIAGEDVGA